MKTLFPLIACSLLVSCIASSKDNPVELGKVDWKTDHDAALALSAETGKPVFLLFQEVPG